MSNKGSIRSSTGRYFKNHKFESILILILMILVFSTFIGLAFVEPYQRLMFYSMLPSQLLMGFLQALMFAGIYSYMFRGTGLPFTGTKVNPETVQVTLDQVIGLKPVKQEVAEVISFLRDHSYLEKAGGRMINGILFTGEPGTGKTLMAKAVATECGLPFIGISGAGFVEMFVGVGASRVRDLFKRARELSEEQGGCVIFIDEFDALAKTREYTPYGSMEDNRTINQFLEKMDGVNKDNLNILVIAATNADVRTLDPAITRPGRFDRHIEFTKPNLEDRYEMLKYYCSGKSLTPDSDLKALARSLPNASGADIENLVNEALHIAMRRGSEVISDGDFSTALERMRLGIERKISLTVAERWAVAVHEAGHAAAQRLFSPNTVIYKLSIIPRSGSLGVTWYEDESERHLRSRTELGARLKVLFGGYAAELAILGDTYDGVTSDMKHATAIARTMVSELGMAGQLGHFPEWGQISESFKRDLDNSVQDLLRNALDEVKGLFLTEDVKSSIITLADALLENDELNSEEVEKYLVVLDAIKNREQVCHRIDMQSLTGIAATLED